MLEKEYTNYHRGINDAIHKEMEKEGYVLVGQGYGFNSNSPYWRYIHKERFNIIVIQDEPIDDEEFFNVLFQMDEDEVEDKLKDKSTMFNWETEEFKELIRELIKEKEEKFKRLD